MPFPERCHDGRQFVILDRQSVVIQNLCCAGRSTIHSVGTTVQRPTAVLPAMLAPWHHRGTSVVDALGLNTASRGIKIDADRPDFIILDDIDDEHDAILTVQKKIRSITRKILPTGANHLSVLAVQNLIHPDSVFAQLEDGRANFLGDRIVSGPHPAIRDLKYEQTDGLTRITGGTPTWEGLSLKRCEEIILDIDIDAFLIEHQHERNLKEGGIVTDLWRDTVHIVTPFEVPRGWAIRRAFDWGSTKPFACLFCWGRPSQRLMLYLLEKTCLLRLCLM